MQAAQLVFFPDPQRVLGGSEFVFCALSQGCSRGKIVAGITHLKNKFCIRKTLQNEKQQLVQVVFLDEDPFACGCRRGVDIEKPGQAMRIDLILSREPGGGGLRFFLCAEQFFQPFGDPVTHPLPGDRLGATG
ncbi:hypothetical protein PXK16_18500 [Phaeobacter gallaeciensis]|nr:hypothetical protein [Phaeobacter gallaeciensis]MDE4155055.1 hypothetical protein [Phaeobacter gallaeciensis]